MMKQVDLNSLWSGFLLPDFNSSKKYDASKEVIHLVNRVRNKNETKFTMLKNAVNIDLIFLTIIESILIRKCGNKGFHGFLDTFIDEGEHNNDDLRAIRKFKKMLLDHAPLNVAEMRLFVRNTKPFILGALMRYVEIIKDDPKNSFTHYMDKMVDGAFEVRRYTPIIPGHFEMFIALDLLDTKRTVPSDFIKILTGDRMSNRDYVNYLRSKGVIDVVPIERTDRYKRRKVIIKDQLALEKYNLLKAETLTYFDELIPGFTESLTKL